MCGWSREQIAKLLGILGTDIICFYPIISNPWKLHVCSDEFHPQIVDKNMILVQQLRLLLFLKYTFVISFYLSFS